MKYDYISFKQFSRWCNQRAADGKWSMNTAIHCSTVCTDLHKVCFLWREKTWKTSFEPEFREIVNEIEHKIDLEQQGKLQEELDKKRAHTEECYKMAIASRYNRPGFRQLNDPAYYMGMPFIVKPECAYTGKKCGNETKLTNGHINLGDYMSQPYDRCYLDESLIYNKFLHKFVYSVDIFPCNVDIYDPLLVITADSLDQFDGDAIDTFLINIFNDAFLEYDKDEIQSMIDQNNETIDTITKENNFLKSCLK